MHTFRIFECRCARMLGWVSFRSSHADFERAARVGAQKHCSKAGDWATLTCTDGGLAAYPGGA